MVMMNMLSPPSHPCQALVFHDDDALIHHHAQDAGPVAVDCDLQNHQPSMDGTRGHQGLCAGSRRR
eukprot:scaffold158049_cov21-Tisochrysis_lutea.AAC.1